MDSMSPATSTPKRPRPSFRPGPKADRTCKLTRVVERGRVKLAIWTCTRPAPTGPFGKFSAYRFSTRYARQRWPGCSSAWYDAHYARSPWGEHCIPGRTQYVVYRGGLRQDQETAAGTDEGLRRGVVIPSSARGARGADRRRG